MLEENIRSYQGRLSCYNEMVRLIEIKLVVQFVRCVLRHSVDILRLAHLMSSFQLDE